MTYVRHMDPSMNVTRRRAAVDGCLVFIQAFCAAANRDAMVKLEASFLEALRDWHAHMMYYATSPRAQRKRVLDTIKRAEQLTRGQHKPERLCFCSEFARRVAVSEHRKQKHMVRTKVDRETLETYYLCTVCNVELRMSDWRVAD